MKILFPLVPSGSGSDVFTSNLVSGLNTSSVTADIQYLPSWSGLTPSLAGRLCDSSGYDIIHSNTWNGYGYKNELPLVITEHHVVHDPHFTPYTSFIQRAFYHYIYRCERKSLDCADQVTTISRYSQKKLEEIFGYSDSRIIYNGIDTSLFSPCPVHKEEWGIDEKTTVLLYVGNHLRRKGADLLAPIMRKLGDDYILLTTTGLRTRGEIPSKNIRSLGKMGIRDLVRAYNICDMLLFPSRLEGFGLCVAEAMACAKPVVTTNCSSLPELIIDGKGGTLCRPDDIQMFTRAVQTLAEDSSLREKQGNFNRLRAVELFCSERMVSEYVRLYEKL